MLVSIIVSAYNEEEYLPDLFLDFVNQSYDLKKIEIILVNSMSTDKTRELMENFKKNNDSLFYNIKIVDNLKKIQPSGFNIGFKSSVGDCILKVDAHSKIPIDFVEKNVLLIAGGESVCGGARPTLIKNTSKFSKTLHLVEENMFGSSIANYRRADKDSYVSSIFHGMYKREVFDKVGLLDEQLIRTEDNEIHHRIRENGYKIRLSKDIVSYQYARPTLYKMLKQKYLNGYWIGLTAHVKKECLSKFHFVPLLFLLSIVGSLILIPISLYPIIILFTVYTIALLLITIVVLISNKFNFYNFLMPILIFLVHLSYGIGTCIGLLNGFSWKKKYKK